MRFEGEGKLGIREGRLNHWEHAHEGKVWGQQKQRDMASFRGTLQGKGLWKKGVGRGG